MSRVGKMPLSVPKGVDVTLSGETISVKGSMGTLVRPVNALVTVNNEEGRLLFAPANDKVYRHPTFYDIPEGVEHL